MYMSDTSAIDRLIDMYGEYLFVKYNDKLYDLLDLRDFFVDNKLNISVDDCLVNSNGIYKDEKLIVSIESLESFGKDDLTKI